MSAEFKLPELGEGIDGGDVIEVLVEEGAQVDEGQTLLELETSKATIPVPAPQSGRVTKLHVKAGDHVKVGQALVTLDGDSRGDKARESKSEKSQRPTSSDRRESPTQAPRAPAAESTYQATPSAAPKRSKQTEASPQPGPSDVQLPAESQRGRTGAHANKPASRPEAEKSLTPVPQTTSEPVAAGPATRRLARELAVDLHLVPGSGPGGRITEEDIKAYVRDGAKDRQTRQDASGGRTIRELAAASEAPPLPDFSRWGPIERQPLGSIRRKTAEHMTLAWSVIPHVTHIDEADITQWEQFRKRHAEQAAAQGAKLTVTAVALKACALALKKFPQFNSTLDAASGELILKQYYHIGVAVDSERGLIVPVIRDVDKKSVLDLALELGHAAQRAREKKLTLDELQGGTFTITNLGGIGGTSFSPIVNYPEVAILGMARAREHQVVRENHAEIRLMLPLCLSYDHRVIDGAAAARFTRHLAELLEEPFLIALEA